MKTMIEWLERPLLRVCISRHHIKTWLATRRSWLARHTSHLELGSVQTSIWGLFRVEVRMSDACAEAEVFFWRVKWLNLLKWLVYLPPSSHFEPPHARQGRHSLSFGGLWHFGDCRNRWFTKSFLGFHHLGDYNGLVFKQVDCSQALARQLRSYCQPWSACVWIHSMESESRYGVTDQNG